MIELQWIAKRNKNGAGHWFEAASPIGLLTVEEEADLKWCVTWTPEGSNDSSVPVHRQVNAFEAKKAAERFVQGVLKRQGKPHRIFKD